MHLLQTIIPFYITLSLTFSTALAMPAAGKKPTPTPTAVSCPQTPKTFSSLPCNISLEFPVPRDIPSGGFDLYSLRLKYYSAFSATGWDYAKIEREENVGNVFQLKDKKLIPLGGSTPASLLRTSFTGGFASGDLRPIVFNPDFDYESTELDFVATRECDDKGKQFLRLRADNAKGPIELYIITGDFALGIGPSPPKGVDPGGLIIKIQSLTREHSEKNYQITGQGGPDSFQPKIEGDFV